MDSPTVCILLATYNGAPYLGEQLASIAAQSHRDWLLYVRDDGSCDATCALLADAAARDPRIRLVEDGLGNLGPCGNFARLLEVVEADYYLFADQDDVWLPDKIAASLAVLRARESEQGRAQPLLVFSDLRVTDAGLHTLHPSELRRHGFDRLIARGLGLRDLLAQNIAAGCTLLFNRALRDAARPIPPEAVMHDWWLALSGLASGGLLYLDQVTLLYRQHGRNQMGAAGPLTRLRQLLLGGAGAYRRRQRQARQQASVLLRRFGDRLGSADRALCSVFARLDRYPPPLRQWLAWRHHLGKTGWLRNAAYYVLM